MSNPKQWVRVRDERTGHHLTVPKRVADSKRHKYTVLKTHAAVDVNGRPLAPVANVERSRKSRQTVEVEEVPPPDMPETEGKTTNKEK